MPSFTLGKVGALDRAIMLAGKVVAIAEDVPAAERIVKALNASIPPIASVMRDKVEYLAHALRADGDRMPSVSFDSMVPPMTRLEVIEHLEDILRIGQGDAWDRA